MRVNILTTVAAACALAVSSVALAEEEKVLNVYNWSDYVAEDTLERFTAETGIKVNYDVYDSNDMLNAKLMAGRSGYDVVFPSASPHLALQIKAGVHQKLDKAKIPNWSNIDPQALATLAKSDPGNEYAAPYMIAATGFAFNAAKLKELMPDAPVDSWSMLFDPKVANKLKSCGVTLLDDPLEVYPAALAWLGRDPVSQSADDLNAATDALLKVRPALKYIHSSSYINDLANGDICLAHGYVGDLVQARQRAREAGKGVDVVIVIPKQGAVVNMDVMAVPADAPHPGNAHAFINFLLKPEIIGAITNATGYANAVTGAAAHVDEAIRNDPVIFPPAEVQAKSFTVPPAPRDYERQRTRAWTRVKTRY